MKQRSLRLTCRQKTASEPELWRSIAQQKSALGKLHQRMQTLIQLQPSLAIPWPRLRWPGRTASSGETEDHEAQMRPCFSRARNGEKAVKGFLAEVVKTKTSTPPNLPASSGMSVALAAAVLHRHMLVTKARAKTRAASNDAWNRPARFDAMCSIGCS